MICGKLVIDAPMQSWCVGDAFTKYIKHTEIIPTKSGLCGLVANALGLERDSELIDDFYVNLKFFIDLKESTIENAKVMRNFHTFKSTNKVKVNGTNAQNERFPLIYKERIDDAKYVIYYYYKGNEDFTRNIDFYLSHPKRPLYFGRQEFPAGNRFNKGILDIDLSGMEELTKISTYRSRMYNRNGV